MKKIINLESCTGCYACYSICPKKCIEMKADKEGFLIPSIDENNCIDCNKCKLICPILNKREPNNNVIYSYAAINKNDKVRNCSSSGGIFYLLAELIINDGGVVYGAGFDDKFHVKHMEISQNKDIKKLQGSKYVQSKIGDTYIKAKERLESGIPVLFTGTPCQIEGLKSYLGKYYSNLYTQDIICHGVPSPLVWDKYLNEFKYKIKNISFRDKTLGWNKFSMKIGFDSKEYLKDLSKDSYLQSFLKNLNLRNSCYNCSFKSIQRNSDLTLADYWGINNVHPEMFDDKGASLIIVHSNKGRYIIDRINKFLKIENTELNRAISYNTAINQSVSYTSKRQVFFKNIDKYNMEELLKVSTHITYVEKIIHILKRGVNKIKRIMKKNDKK